MNNYLPAALVFGSLLLSLSAAQAADPARGEQLYNTHCTACHASLMGGDKTAIFTRPKRIVRSFDGLKKRVQFCESMTSTDWTQKEIDDVVAYLNQEFYKFKEKPNG